MFGRYNLPSEYIRNSVLVLLSSQAVVRQNTVHTSSYAARFEARVRGCLRGCLQPVILSQLATRHGFDPDLLNSTVQKMIREEVILGKFQGGAFTPKAYTDAEAKKMDSFFESNGFLTAAMAKTCNLTLKEWVAQRKVEGHTLLSAFVSQHVVEEVQAAVAEALAAGAWIDVQPLLPPSLPRMLQSCCCSCPSSFRARCCWNMWRSAVALSKASPQPWRGKCSRRQRNQ